MMRSLAAAGALLVLSLPGPAAAQQPAEPTPPPGSDVVMYVDKGQVAQLALAFPAFHARGSLSRAAQTAVAELETTLRDDLAATGIFVVHGPDELAVLDLTGDQVRDFELYRSLGDEIVLLGEVYEEGGRLVLEGRVYDLASGQSILGKRYRGGFDLTRRMAHAFADEIVLYFSGRRGVALTTIAFSSDRSGDKEIYLMDWDGRNVRPLTGHRSISMAPSWSPTGDAVAYVSFFDGAPGIYLVDLASGNKRPAVNDGSLNISPSFSPDGRQIVFARSLEGNTEIFVAGREGGGLRRLTHSAGIDANPAWSPTGKQIAFTSSRAGNPHVYLMDVEGTNLRRLTFEGDYNDGAAWSPDGAKIAYATRRRGDFDIAVTDVALLETTVLTAGRPGSHESPTWSPDGRFIAYTTTVGGRTQIHVMRSDGSDDRLLTGEGNSWAPDWSAYPPEP